MASPETNAAAEVTVATVQPEDVSSNPPQINDHCKIRWRDGEKILLAKVVERRPLIQSRRNKKRKGFGSAAEMEALKAEQIEYYVHYVHHDRRLDEWVTIDKFMLETLVRAEQLQKEKAEQEESKSRPSRRRSNVNSAANKSNQEGSSFSLTGGNWHGNSGDPTLAALEEEHEEATKVKNIGKVVIGAWEVEACTSVLV